MLIKVKMLIYIPFVTRIKFKVEAQILMKILLKILMKIKKQTHVLWIISRKLNSFWIFIQCSRFLSNVLNFYPLFLIFIQYDSFLYNSLIFGIFIEKSKIITRLNDFNVLENLMLSFSNIVVLCRWGYTYRVSGS